MLIKFLNECDFVNYKKPSMFIGFPYCTFKCGREICQNYSLINDSNIETTAETLINRYVNNPVTEAIVFGGLEPFDSFDDLLYFITELRKVSTDDVVIYTGYTEDELTEQIEKIRPFGNIIVKFGRYVDGEEQHFDDVLGIKLSSNNQYAKII